MSVAEFVLSLALNGPAFIVVLMYFLRLKGSTPFCCCYFDRLYANDTASARL